jgi:UDP-N-acetylglucosamine 2-epimerase (non-hydrolysing)/GDP/UDP-N,N'-diacetylbacillosamine 2-epimerase (hydrolysing)
MKVAVITTSRADWNALGMVADAMRADGGFDVSIVMVDSVQGKAVRDEGWFPSIIYSGAGSSYPTRSGNIVDAVGDLLLRENPDLVMILGDRWETLAVAMGAAMAGIPIAHLSGGDITYGSLDDRYRNAISHLSQWHFATHKDAVLRLLKMDVPGRVWNVGSPAVDRIAQTECYGRAAVMEMCGLAQCEHLALINWQPETANKDPNLGLRELLFEVGAYDPDKWAYVFVGQNDDVRSKEAAAMIARHTRPNTVIIPNMAPRLYLSALRWCDVLVGNSSSGIYEAPAFGTPVVNIGDRQRGRPTPRNVVHAERNSTDISAAITNVVMRGRLDADLLFGDGTASQKIVEVLKHLPL